MTQVTIQPPNQVTQTSWPQWITEIRRSLVARPQFVLSGNIRDMYLTPFDEDVALLPIIPCIWESLSQEGYNFLLVYDMVDSLRVYPEEPSTLKAAERFSGLGMKNGCRVISQQELPRCLRSVIGAPSPSCQNEISAEVPRVAVIIDYASRLVSDPQNLAEPLQEFFTSFEKFSHIAIPKSNANGTPQYSPVIWLVNKTGDLPDWFLIGNDSVRSLTIPLPDFEMRKEVAALLAPAFSDYDTYAETQQQSLVKDFADLTDGMSVKSMMAVTQIALSEPRISFNNIGDAVRCYKIGLPNNPWKKESMREKIAGAEELIKRRIQGQSEAITKTLDILKRSVLSLTGAHTSGNTNRPRGILFFAGPTGVGKTELSKTVAKVLFGDEEAYIRFDMSEFSAEHSDQRLIGAPPGYVGYDTGGELTNAVRQRPFSVILFDEIEKGHPRILDKFLQILDDGRLTDGRGDTVYFSEAVIIFTSNLGVFVPADKSSNVTSQRVQNVKPGMNYEEVKSNILEAIKDYFKFELNRPELLNRIGDNIVIFNFIEPEVAEEILDKMLKNIINRIFEEHQIHLEVSPPVRDLLTSWCLKDLSDGGRGIGNTLETCFVNPLARALFARRFNSGEKLTVQHIEHLSDRYEIQFS
jgi:ATP-dependent Clp protease ATP-binding subunit ClpB